MSTSRKVDCLIDRSHDALEIVPTHPLKEHEVFEVPLDIQLLSVTDLR